MWFIGVEVEHEPRRPPPPKKIPGSAPVLTAARIEGLNHMGW